MCGIAGFIDFRFKSNQEILREMIDSISHRGPDGSGISFFNTNSYMLGLGHRRLSIIDLSEDARQPMNYNGLHIIFNGEIYNYKEIKKELIERGHSFFSHSDTEVILHSVEEWGIDQAIKKWRGMFAIVLFDERKQELICIRDRAGVKPFYYYYAEGSFIFGSELKCILKHPTFPKIISEDSLVAYLQYGYVPNPYSIFDRTYKIQPGYYLKFDLKTRELEEKQYWNVYDYYNRPKISISENDAISETEYILEESFKYRMIADVPVGVFLSGGFDSTCVTAILQKDNVEKIKTFTIGSDDTELNEAGYAREIANCLGTDHTEYICTSKEALEIIPTLPYFFDEPFADSSAIPTILVSQLAKQKVTVALSADAGDEIFAGYNRYDYIIKYNRIINEIPIGIRKLAAGFLDTISSNRIPFFNQNSTFHSRYDKIKNYLLDSRPSNIMKGVVQTFNDHEIKKYISIRYNALNSKHISNQLKQQYSDPLSLMLATDYETYLTDDILQKVDRATMSVSLEGREPFLDQHIIEWAAQLPNSLKYRNGEKKYLLKKIVYKYVPETLMNRPKMGFGIPIESWLLKELRPLLNEYLNEDKLSHHGYFNIPEVIKLKEQFFEGYKNKHTKLWFLLIFQMWYEKWMKSN